MFLADFHVHTNFSDGRLGLPEVVDLYGRNGFGCIAITDHLCERATFLGVASAYLGCTLTPATFPIYLALLRSEAERAWKQYRMIVLPGVELTKNSISNHRSAHIVGIGIHSYIESDADVLDLARAVRAQGGIAIAAHPVWTRKMEKQTYHIWNRRHELEKEFDAWEVASGPYVFEEVAKTKYPKIASSDLHLPHHIRSWKTVLECERHPEAILEAIRKQQLSFRFYEGETAYAASVPSARVVGVRHSNDLVGNLVRA